MKKECFIYATIITGSIDLIKNFLEGEWQKDLDKFILLVMSLIFCF